MARRAHKESTQAQPTEEQALADAAPVEQAAQTTREPGDDGEQAPTSHAAAVGKKKFTPPADPFGFENHKGTGNRIHLLKSEADQAWVIRFEKPPNEMEGYSKENPHPVIQMLKNEGCKWGFDSNDGKGGWGLPWTGDPYGTDHMNARRVLKAAAEMIGAPHPEAVRDPF